MEFRKQHNLETCDDGGMEKALEYRTDDGRMTFLSPSGRFTASSTGHFIKDILDTGLDPGRDT